MNPQAEELNAVLQKDSPAIYRLLSERGKGIYYPKKGILAQTAEAKGKGINATIGAAIEDDGTPMRLGSIEKQLSLNPSEAFSYAPSYGKPELRTLWLEKIRQKNPSLKGRTSVPVVTCAVTHGLTLAGYLFVGPGDHIILTDKFWGNYRLIFENGFGGVLDFFDTFAKEGFNVGAFRKKLGSVKGKTTILLNFPNNPSGYTVTQAEAREIIAAIKEHAEKGNDTLVICDDAYFGLVYEDGVYEESLFAQLATLHERVLAMKLDGVTKEEYAWGFRVGFITFACRGITEGVCAALEAKTAGAVRGTISNAPHISQSLVLKAFTSRSYAAEKSQKYSILKSRFEKVRQSLSDPKYLRYFKALPFNSGYFMCIELKHDAEPVRKKLLEAYDTGVISIGNMLRIAYSSVPESDIPQLFENIYKACKEQ